MMHLRVQSIICLELHKKVTNSSPKCNWDCEWQGILHRMLSKMDLRVQVDAKSDQLKNETKSEIFSAPGDANNKRNFWCALYGTI